MASINPSAYYNPDINGVGPATAPVYQMPTYRTQPTSTMIFVRGINEAANYPAVQPVLLMDANDSVFYIKDQNGLRIFDYTERTQNGNGNSEFVTKKEFDELKKLIDDLIK